MIKTTAQKCVVVFYVSTKKVCEAHFFMDLAGIEPASESLFIGLLPSQSLF